MSSTTPRLLQRRGCGRGSISSWETARLLRAKGCCETLGEKHLLAANGLVGAWRAAGTVRSRSPAVFPSTRSRLSGCVRNMLHLWVHSQQRRRL